MNTFSCYAPVISLVLVGCGASTMPPTSSAASTKQALIAQRCARTPAEQEAGGSGYARVFIQAAQVVSDELREPLGAWLGEHAVAAPSVISFIAAAGQPTPVSWTRCLDAECASSDPWQLIVTPTLPARADDPVLLMVRARREGDSEDQTQRTELETRNQEPVVLDLAEAEASPVTVVVTPYLIGDDEDLHRLAECKSRSF